MKILLYLFGLIVALLIAAVGELVSDEIRARLDRLPMAVLRAAARRLPRDQRGELYGQAWLPELRHILQGDEAMPITRLIHGMRYALRIWLSAPQISREFGAGPARHSLLRLFRPSLGVVLIAGPLPITALAVSFAAKHGSWLFGLIAVTIASCSYIIVGLCWQLLLLYLSYWPNSARWCRCKMGTISQAVILPVSLTATCGAALVPLVDQQGTMVHVLLDFFTIGTSTYFYLLRIGYGFRIIYMMTSLLRRDMSGTASTD